MWVNCRASVGRDLGNTSSSGGYRVKITTQIDSYPGYFKFA